MARGAFDVLPYRLIYSIIMCIYCMTPVNVQYMSYTVNEVLLYYIASLLHIIINADHCVVVGRAIV